MIARSELEHRLGITTRALAHRHQARHPARGVTARRLSTALEQLQQITPSMLTLACAHLDEHQAGYPATSVPAGHGSGGHSDRTGTLVCQPYADPDVDHDRARPEVVTVELAELDQRTARLRTTSLRTLVDADTYQLARTIETDTIVVTRILFTWAREPDTRWCVHCLATNGHREPVLWGRYKDLCRECGEWRSVNKKLPHKDLIEYLQRHQRHRIPQRLLNKHRVKVPRPRKPRRT